MLGRTSLMHVYRSLFVLWEVVRGVYILEIGKRPSSSSPFQIIAGFGVVRIDPQGLMIMVNGLLELAAFL